MNSQPATLMAMLALTVPLATSSIISVPTTYTDTLSIFDVSEYESMYNHTFNGHTIDCGSTETCYIHCGGTESSICSSMTINASLTSNLILYCGPQYSCSSFQLQSGPLTSFQMTCSDERSCYESQINLINTTYIGILCGLNGSSFACQQGGWYFQDALTVDLDCGDGGCRELDLTLFTTNNSNDTSHPQENGYLAIACGDYRACIGASVYVVEYEHRFVSTVSTA